MRTGDDPDAVRANRARLAQRLGLDTVESWWWLHQVHGAGVVVASGSPPGVEPKADAAVSTEVGTPLVVLSADCAPLVLACDDAIGVVHAGWRGLMGGVVDAAVQALRSMAHGEVRAALGPCIHAAHYEFGRGDLDRVVGRFGSSVEGLTAEGRPALDLPAAVRVALVEVGVSALEDVEVCTASSSDHFSHRRDHTTGRQALVAVLEG